MRVVPEELARCAAAFGTAGRGVNDVLDVLAARVACAGAAMPAGEAAPDYVLMWDRWRTALEHIAHELQRRSAVLEDAAHTYLEADTVGTRAFSGNR